MMASLSHTKGSRIKTLVAVSLITQTAIVFNIISAAVSSLEDCQCERKDCCNVVLHPIYD